VVSIRSEIRRGLDLRDANSPVIIRTLGGKAPAGPVWQVCTQGYFSELSGYWSCLDGAIKAGT
jgi:hypothetical protein